jgi:hypothetical protein
MYRTKQLRVQKLTLPFNFSTTALASSTDFIVANPNEIDQTDKRVIE